MGIAIGGSALLFLLFLSHFFPFHPWDLPFLILFVACLLLHTFRVELPIGQLGESAEFPLVVSAIIFYGPSAGAWLDSLAFFFSCLLDGERRKDILTRDLSKALFYLSILFLNIGILAWPAGIAGLTWAYASHFASPQECYKHILALFLLTLIYFFPNTFLSSLMGSIWEGKSLREIWWSNSSWGALFVFLQTALGVAFVLVYQVGGVFLLLLALLTFLYIMRRFYVEHLRRRELLLTFIGLLHGQLEKVDVSTRRHCEMVGRLAEEVGRKLGVPGWRLEVLRQAAMLHDVGKIALDEETLFSSKQLSPEEREFLKSHTSVPYEAMQEVDFLKPLGELILFHHERLNGSGYWGKKGEEIGIEARIIGVVDAFHALVSPRPYRQPSHYTLEEALEILDEEARQGKRDRRTIDALKEVLKERPEIVRELYEA